MGFLGQEYWSGLPFPSPGDLHDPGIEPASPALSGGFFTAEAPGNPGPMVGSYKYGLWAEGSGLKDRKDIKATFQSTGLKMSTFHKTMWIWQLCRLAFMNITRDIWTQSVQLLSCVWLFATPWRAARRASLSITNSRNLLKLMSVELVMPSNHLIQPFGPNKDTN